MKVIVTGGAGFIGSALVKTILHQTDWQVLILDKLTYAAIAPDLSELSPDGRCSFAQLDICCAEPLSAFINTFAPDAIFHLAAETHVDRSISGPADFIQSNIFGTYQLLEAAKQYWLGLSDVKKHAFRLLHVSTDEVYGDIAANEPAATELNPYAPSSPYSASKAAADHLVMAWHRTYGLPVIITHSSNNFGPGQYPEKLIPRMISNALRLEPLPLYGDGQQIRDWLYVYDHVHALLLVIQQGQVGSRYNIAGDNQLKNIDLVLMLAELLDELAFDKKGTLQSYRDLIQFVQDRPGHDIRYALDASKIRHELSWSPAADFKQRLRETVLWHLASLSGGRMGKNGKCDV